MGSGVALLLFLAPVTARATTAVMELFGTITDAATDHPLPATLKYQLPDEGQIGEIVPEADGSYRLPLVIGKTYQLEVAAPGYAPISEAVLTRAGRMERNFALHQENSRASTLLGPASDTLPTNRPPQASQQLPSLETIIDLCLAYSPVLRLQDSEVEKYFNEVKTRRGTWSDFVFADLGAGVTNQPFLSQGNDGNVSFLNYDMIQYYRAGILVRMPLSSLTHQHREVTVAKTAYQSAQLKREVITQELTNQVTSLYYEVVADLQLLKIKSETRQFLSLEKTLAEESLNVNGVAPPNLKDVTLEAAAADMEYELLRKQLLTHWRLLENMIGQKLRLDI